MAAVYPGKRPIVHGLQSELEPEISFFGQIANQIERLVGQAIRPRRNREPDDTGKVEGFTVKFFQLRGRVVSIGVTLKISDEPFRSMSSLQRQRALFELDRDRSARPVILRRVTRVVAINTSADGHCAVPVRAREVQSQADLVDALVENLTQLAIVRIEALAAPAIS